MKYDYEKLDEFMTERLNNVDINEVAKFFSTSDYAIAYRDEYLNEEFQNWLKTFEDGGENEGEEYCDWNDGSDYFVASDDMCEFLGEHFLFPSGISFQDCLDNIDGSGEGSEYFQLESDFFSEIRDTILEKNIIPDALELTRTMNNGKVAA
jgi:hypothetical protein